MRVATTCLVDTNCINAAVSVTGSVALCAIDQTSVGKVGGGVQTNIHSLLRLTNQLGLNIVYQMLELLVKQKIHYIEICNFRSKYYGESINLIALNKLLDSYRIIMYSSYRYCLECKGVLRG
jgi:hypothetical protein